MSVVTRRSLVVLGLFILPAGCDKSGDVVDARQLAETGQVDLAVKKLEGVIASDPEFRPAYLALGDVRLQAALATRDAGKERTTLEPMLAQAATAYEGALKLGSDGEGLVRVKRSVALGGSGDRAASQREAEEAWACCAEPSALPALNDAALVEALRRWEGTFGSWTPHPVFTAYPQSERLAFIVRPEGAPVLPLGSTEAVRTMPPLESGRAYVQDDGFLLFRDEAFPATIEHDGYVGMGYCMDGGGEPCATKKQIVDQGRHGQQLDVGIYGGSCLNAFCPGGYSPKANLSNLVSGSVWCVGDGDHNTSSITMPACKVSYQRLEVQQRQVSADRVWLIPEVGMGSPSDAIRAAHQAGKADIRDHLGAGELATGLPEPLARWAWGDAKPTVRITEVAITATFDAAAGKFVVTNGVLTSWEPKPFDRAAAEVAADIGDGD